MMIRPKGLLLVSFCLWMSLCTAQERPTVWFDGLSRSLFARDAMGAGSPADSVSERSTSAGYNLLDLNVHVNPTSDMEVMAQLRVRNELGGFFGTGTTVDVRQLTLRGTIDNKIRYQVGDMFLRQTRFTLFNSASDAEVLSTGFQPYRDVIDYENFYGDNRWRLQGLQTDFSLQFARFIRTLAMDAFITRPRGSVLTSSGTYLSDRLLGGASVVADITKQWQLGLHHVNLFEVPNSGTLDVAVRNPVHCGVVHHQQSGERWIHETTLHAGTSNRTWVFAAEDQNDLTSSGAFWELDSRHESRDSLWNWNVGYRYVEPEFRSAAAQTRRLDWSSAMQPSTFATYTNDQLARRLSVFDLLVDPLLYNQALAPQLMQFNPFLSNVSPYSDATPNRMGVFGSLEWGGIKKAVNAALNLTALSEVIGQGTENRRRFGRAECRVHWAAPNLLNIEKGVDVTFHSKAELTRRDGNEFEELDLLSIQSSMELKAGLSDALTIHASASRWTASGEEFLSIRDAYGNLFNFEAAQVDRSDWIFASGLSYEWNKHTYASIQYQWWGANDRDEAIPDFQYERLFFILTIDL